MGQVADDIMNGIVCQDCQCWLLDDAENLCDIGVPTYCESCWHDLPKKRKKNTNVWWDDPARNKGGGDE